MTGKNVTVADGGRREIANVQDAVPILDTDRFEHMQRVASVMAGASLIPTAIRGSSKEETFSNCFLVVNQAVRWGMDPFAVAQGIFVLHGKIGYEGKMVAAMIEAKIGESLDYEWEGTPGTDEYKITVSGHRPSDGKLVEISGTVGDWKTFDNSGNPKPAWQGLSTRNQLAYRGTREWARLFAPALMLGVYTADEMEGLTEDARANRARDVTSIAPPDPGDEDEKPKPRGRPKKTDEDKVEKEAEPEVEKVEEKPKQEKAKEPAKKVEEKKNDSAVSSGSDAASIVEGFDKLPKDLQEGLAKLHANFKKATNIGEAKAIWTARFSVRSFTDEEQEHCVAIRDWHKERLAKPAEEKKDPPDPDEDEGGAEESEGATGENDGGPPDPDGDVDFDFDGFKQMVVDELAKCKSEEEVINLFNELTEIPLRDDLISEDQMDDDLRPLCRDAMEKLGA